MTTSTQAISSAPTTQDRPIDIFCASFKRPSKLTAMIESVLANDYPVRICVAAGDLDTVRACEQLDKRFQCVECVYDTASNRLTGCTAPLNHVVDRLVRRDAVFCTDDVLYERDCIRNAVRALDRHFPTGDGVIGLSVGNIDGDYALAFPLYGRAFQQRFRAIRSSGGPLFFPGYFHMFNDAEIGRTIRALNCWHLEPTARLRHEHPDHGGILDQTHTHALTFSSYDLQLWNSRCSRGLLWGIDEEDVHSPDPAGLRRSV